MGDYYVNGYTPPRGVDSRQKVKSIQATLGVKQDGIWGPQTQTAWREQGFGHLWVPKTALDGTPVQPGLNHITDSSARPTDPVNRQVTHSSQSNSSTGQAAALPLAQIQSAPGTQNGVTQKSNLPVNNNNVTNRQAAANIISSQTTGGSERTNQPQLRRDVAASATWSKATQEAWDKFFSSQSGYTPQKEAGGQPSESAKVPNRAAEELAKLISAQLEDMGRMVPDKPSPKPAEATPAPQETVDRSGQRLGWAISKRINSARLTNYEKEHAASFVNELSPQQTNLVASWIDEKGVEKLFHGYNIRSTAEKLIRETVTNPTELSITPELAQPSYFRPRIYDFDLDTWEKEFPKSKFSNFYYLDGEYYVDVSYEATRYWGAPILVVPISVGKDLPRDSVVRVSRPHIPMLILEQVRLLGEIELTLENFLGIRLNQLFGDNLFTSMPGISDALGELDPWSHYTDIDGESIVIDVLSSYEGGLFKPFNGHEQVIVNRIPQ